MLQTLCFIEISLDEGVATMMLDNLSWRLFGDCLTPQQLVLYAHVHSHEEGK